MPQNVLSQTAKFALSSMKQKIPSCVRCLSRISSITQSLSLLQLAQHGAISKIAARTYDVFMHTSSKEQDPSKKLTNIKDVKRYLNTASISKDGLLVVKRALPFVATSEAIVVPRSVLDGLLTALHVRLNHPSRHQLQTVTQASLPRLRHELCTNPSLLILPYLCFTPEVA